MKPEELIGPIALAILLSLALVFIDLTLEYPMPDEVLYAVGT